MKVTINKNKIKPKKSQEKEEKVHIRATTV